MSYPDGSLQKYFHDDSWWEKTKERQPASGRLIWAFVPHVDIIPKSLIPTGRAEDEATNHSKASYEIADLRIKSVFKKNSLPAAILPRYKNECYTVHRSKKRPALLISDGGSGIPEQLRLNMKQSWHANSTILVAPYYSAVKKGVSKWYEPFIEKIKRCEYPQYLWDTLPVQSSTESSILRFDHIQPIGKDRNSYELTDYALKEDVMEFLLKEWLDWLLTGEIDIDSILNEIKNDLRDS